MKKIFSFFAAALMAAGVATAQDINKAIELANNGNEAFQMGEYQLAVDAFSQSLAIAEGLGEAGAEHANTCKTALGAIYLANSKNLIKASDFAGALAKLEETIAVAGKYGLADIAEDAKALIPNVFMAQGNAALKVKDMAGAITAYTKVTELNPTNGDAYLRLGRALAASGKVAEAVAAYETAAANGEEADAKKQLSNLSSRRHRLVQRLRTTREQSRTRSRLTSILRMLTHTSSQQAHLRRWAITLSVSSSMRNILQLSQMQRTQQV